MSQGELAEVLNCGQPAVSKIERGAYPLTPQMRRSVESVLALAADDGHATWFVPYLEIEQSATSLRNWEGPLVPGLMQTPDYARHVLAAANPGIPAAELDQQVAARMMRQEIWRRTGRPAPMFAAVIGESALRRMVGTPLVMREQMLHLAAASAHPCVSVQVLPFGAGGSAGLLASFALASFAPDDRPDAAYLDDALAGHTTQARARVAKLALIYDALAREALRPRDSAELITEVAGEWT